MIVTFKTADGVEVWPNELTRLWIAGQFIEDTVIHSSPITWTVNSLGFFKHYQVDTLYSTKDEANKEFLRRIDQRKLELHKEIGKLIALEQSL